MNSCQWKYRNYVKVHITISCSNSYPYCCRDMPGQDIKGQSQIKAGFEISTDPPVCNRQKCFWVEKIKTLPVSFCPGSCKMVIYAHSAQLNYGLDVKGPLPFLYSFELWFDVLNITHTYRCGNTCLCVVLGQHLWLT